MKTEALQDEHITDRCIDRTQGPETDISPECLRAAMEAMFHDRYNFTVTYNDQVGQEPTDVFEFTSTEPVDMSTGTRSWLGLWRLVSQ
jgi:gamma-glutamylcysteine synthetase